MEKRITLSEEQINALAENNQLGLLILWTLDEREPIEMFPLQLEMKRKNTDLRDFSSVVATLVRANFVAMSERKLTLTDLGRDVVSDIDIKMELSQRDSERREKPTQKPSLRTKRR